MKYFLALIVFCISQLAVATVEIKWGMREDLVYFKKTAYQFKNEIEKITQGEVKIKIESYSNADDAKWRAVDRLRKGDFDISQEVVGRIESSSPILKLWSLPFLFRNEAHLEKYIKTLGQKHLETVKEEGLLPVNYSFSGGFVAIIGKKLNSFDDLKKQKLVLEEDYPTFEYYLNTSEVELTKDRSKLLDYNEFILAVADEILSSDHINEIHVNLTEHRAISRIVFIKQSTFDRIPKKFQQTFMKTLKKYLDQERKYSLEGRKLVQLLVENRGAQLNIWSDKLKNTEKEKFKSSYQIFEKEFPQVIQQIQKVK